MILYVYNLVIDKPTRIYDCDRQKIQTIFHESLERFLSNLHFPQLLSVYIG
ncbi:conserved hypothetical protein [Trichormus variabilis ATCC 29413]|uniref:Uncharacterized protein n=1 Tax=Trichormus variabilis (strain ATCC 29413 / PCC 7937) TaxID=240292 RepID=Q3MGP7_TRIV2|nr:conserved hypothetical protein [Trichormus variabilis ATCC 29413]